MRILLGGREIIVAGCFARSSAVQLIIP